MPPVPIPPAAKGLARVLTRLTTIRRPQAKFAVGLDLGASAVKAVLLGARRAGGARAVIKQEIVPLPVGQDDPTESVKSAMSALGAPVRTVAMGVSGPWVILRVVELPAMKPDEMKQALPFEAQRYLPFNVQDVAIDGAALGPASEGKVWVLIVACKKELVERRVDCAKRAGLDLRVLDVDALALTNAYLTGANGKAASGVRVLVDLGAQVTNLVVFRDKIPYLVRDIPWGAEKLVRSMADVTGQEAAALEPLLREPSLPPDVAAALKSGSEALVTELQLSFDYFENRFGQAPEEVLVTGGLADSQPFMEALRSHVAQTVTPWAPAPGLSGRFTVAYGLALRAG